MFGELPPREPPPAGLQLGFVTRAERAEVEALERLPIDSLWVGGHVASPNPTPETMVGLARLSSASERVRIGSSILLLPLFPPAIVAKQVADLDRATGGRVTLGVGIGGEYPQEFRACQVPVSERGRRTDEAIPLLRRLWTGEEVTHDGRYYAMEQVRIHPAPVQPGGPPVVVAGRQEPAMRRAARLGDGWMPYLYSPRRYAASVATIRAAADELGRELTSFEWFAFVFVNVKAEAAAARSDAARSIGGLYSQDFSELVKTVVAAGTVDEVATRLQAYVDAGARHLILAPATEDDRDRIVRRVVEEVMPRLTVPD
jgi:probable F420-dependent oxidoreductase